MNRFWLPIVAVAGLVLTVTVVSSQPPEKGDKGPRDKREGLPPGRPPRFELGRVLPPPLVEELELTKDQQAEIAKLEKEVKERLSKILTAEQRKKVENFRPRGPGGRPDGPPRPNNGDEKPKRPDGPQKKKVKGDSAGIQWFATLESGLHEAERTGRPILFVSAAPHCAGVSGIW